VVEIACKVFEEWSDFGANNDVLRVEKRGFRKAQRRQEILCYRAGRVPGTRGTVVSEMGRIAEPEMSMPAERGEPRSVR
jgi:hypothetical protein